MVIPKRYKRARPLHKTGTFMTKVFCFIFQAGQGVENIEVFGCLKGVYPQAGGCRVPAGQICLLILTPSPQHGNQHPR